MVSSATPLKNTSLIGLTGFSRDIRLMNYHLERNLALQAPTFAQLGTLCV